MAMTACKECGGEISTTAKACPKCGATTPRPKIWPWLIGIPIALLGMFLLFGASIPEYVARARQVREACEQIAALSQRYICDQQYDDAIAKGRAEANH